MRSLVLSLALSLAPVLVVQRNIIVQLSKYLESLCIRYSSFFGRLSLSNLIPPPPHPLLAVLALWTTTSASRRRHHDITIFIVIIIVVVIILMKKLTE